MAAGMARHGLLPVVNSFASFLASRANEQIYNQVSERTKVVYAMHYAGSFRPAPENRTRACATRRCWPRSPESPLSIHATRRRHGSCRVGAGGAGERRDPARDRSLAAQDRAARRTTGRCPASV